MVLESLGSKSARDPSKSDILKVNVHGCAKAEFGSHEVGRRVFFLQG